MSQFVQMKTESGPNIFGEIWTIFMRYVEFLAHLFSYFCPNAFIQTHIIKKKYTIIHIASLTPTCEVVLRVLWSRTKSCWPWFSYCFGGGFLILMLFISRSVISRSFCKVNFPHIAFSTLFASWIHLQKAFSLIFPSLLKSFFKTRIGCLFKQTRLNTTASLWHRL